MELRYKLTDQDVVDMLRTSSRPLWALLVFALLLTLMWMFGIYMVRQDVTIMGWIWLAASVGLGVIVYILPPIQARRALRRHPVLQGEIVLLVNDEGIESTFATGKTQLQWRAYKKYRETPRVFVLQSSSLTFIPKRVMSPQQIEELRGLLRARIPSQATPRQTA